LALAIGGFPSTATALSAGEIAMFTDTYFNCPNGGKGLYTTVDIPDLSAWGFDNAMSAYSQNGGWKLYDGYSYATLLITTGTGTTSNCNVGSYYNDRVSSLKEY
jgi:hypothetical protein